MKKYKINRFNQSSQYFGDATKIKLADSISSSYIPLHARFSGENLNYSKPVLMYPMFLKLYRAYSVAKIRYDELFSSFYSGAGYKFPLGKDSAGVDTNISSTYYIIFNALGEVLVCLTVKEKYLKKFLEKQGEEMPSHWFKLFVNHKLTTEEVYSRLYKKIVESIIAPMTTAEVSVEYCNSKQIIENCYENSFTLEGKTLDEIGDYIKNDPLELYFDESYE